MVSSRGFPILDFFPEQLPLWLWLRRAGLRGRGGPSPGAGGSSQARLRDSAHQEASLGGEGDKKDTLSGAPNALLNQRLLRAGGAWAADAVPRTSLVFPARPQGELPVGPRREGALGPCAVSAGLLEGSDDDGFSDADADP